MEVGRFLYNAGLYKQLMEFAIDKLKRNKPVPWPFVLQSLTDQKITVSKNQAKILYKNMIANHEQENSPYIFACKKWGENSKEFELFRTVFLEKLEEENVNSKEELLKNLEFVQSQGLVEEEEKIINQLLELDPDEKKYQKLFKNLKEKTALQFIKKQKQSRQSLKSKKEESLLFSPKDTPLKKKLVKDVLQVSRKSPERTKDLSIFLYMMGWPDAGLKLLDTAPLNPEICWLYLEWLMEAKQYTASVELANQLIHHTGGEPEKLFFINYIKAIALYHLGEKKQAIDHLNDIIMIRPDYKSAQSLLEKWLKK